MFAAINNPSLVNRGLLAALRKSISRDEFFAGLYIIGCVNGLLGRVIYSVSFDSWASALSAVDINVIVLFACFAGVSVVLKENKGDIEPADIAVGGIFLGLVILPIYPLSWMAVTGLSLYILLFIKAVLSEDAAL